MCGWYKEGFGPPRLPAKINFDSGSNELLFEPPEGFRNNWSGCTAIDFSSDVWNIYPRDPAVAQKILKNAWFSPYGVTAAFETPAGATYLTYTLPNWWETIQAYFMHRGFESRLSPPAQYANAFVNLIGGLQGASVFATQSVYRLLDALALKSSKKVAQRIIKELNLNQLVEENLIHVLRDAEVVPELKRVPRTLNDLSQFGEKKELLSILERLSAVKVVKRGFHATCPNCLTPTWHPLHSIGEFLTCPGCANVFLFPVEQKKGSGVELSWEYTLNSLVNRVMDQDVLPCILALFHETKPACDVPFVPGIELIPKGETNILAEFDYLFVKDQNLVAGECKTGTELAVKDIDGARLAARLGVKEFAFCTIRQFSDSSLALVDGLRSELKSSDDRPMAIKVLSGEQLLGTALP